MKAIAIAIGMIAALSSTVASAAVPSITHYGLRLSDMPKGFVQVKAHVQSNAETDHLNKQKTGTAARSGRITGYETDFRPKQPTGLLAVGGYVEQFHSTAQARAGVTASTSQIRHPQKGTTVRTIATGHLGDAATGYEVHTKTQGIPIVGYIIFFRRGPYEATLATSGVEKTYKPSVALHFADIIDSRLPH